MSGNGDGNISISAEELEILPIDVARTIPARWYSDRDFFDKDNKDVFFKSWQYVSHTSKIANYGDFILVTVAGNPVIVIRDKGDKIRAFYNVCRHRGGPVEIIDGNTKIFKCKYHGWTYNLDGKLRGVPEFEQVNDFSKSDFGLLPLRIEEWQNLLFVCLDENVPSLDTFLKGIQQRILPNDLTTKKFHKRITYDIRCNWKVYVDNYLEGYHIAMVHPGLAKLLDYKKYVTELYDYYSLQYSPIRGNTNVYKSSEGGAFYYFVFPNFMLNILPGRLQTNFVVPVANDRTSVVFDYYYDDIESDEALKTIEEDLHSSDLIQDEDIEICEHVQKGLNSAAYNQGRFSVKREQGVYHFQTLLKKAYASILFE